MPNNAKIVMTVTNEFATDYRVYREASALAAAGYDVTLFCLKSKTLPDEEIVNGIKVRRILEDYIKLPLSAKSRQVRKTWLQALRRAKADLYHAHDRDTLDYSVKVARERKVPAIYDSHEFWQDKNRYQNNTGNLRDKLSTYWWNKKEKHNALRADAMIMSSPGHAEEFVNRIPVKPPVIVRNIPLFQRGQDKNYFRNKFNLNKNSQIVVYVGNIQKNRGLEETIASLDLLPSKIHFVVLGYGDYRKELEQNTPDHLKSRVHFHDPVHFLKVVPLLYSADMGIAPIQPSCLSYYRVLPNKPFEYLMAELPIAVSDFPEMREIVEDSQAGTVFDPQSPKEIADAITKILGDPARYLQYKAKASAASKNKYRWDLEKEHLLKLYRGLLK